MAPKYVRITRNEGKNLSIINCINENASSLNLYVKLNSSMCYVNYEKWKQFSY